MSISISSALSTIAVAGAATAQQPVQTTEPASNSGDTVTLTEAQQVYALYTQGQTVSQIASTLSLPVNQVNDYLGITSSS